MAIAAWTIVAILAFALMLVLMFRSLGKFFPIGEGLMPPHEFAYGASLRSSDVIPDRIDQFLSLEVLEPDRIQIETSSRDSGATNLEPLVRHVLSRPGPDFAKLGAELKVLDQLPDQKQKAIQLVKLLIPYKELLKNESEQDSIIVFVNYRLKHPREISPPERAKIGRLVRHLDTPEQANAFDAGQCPVSFLGGNVNLYPLNLDNTSWHDIVTFDAPDDAPILEIRFMGLRGIFRYLLDEMTVKTGTSFQHLDGESL